MGQKSRAEGLGGATTGKGEGLYGRLGTSGLPLFGKKFQREHLKGDGHSRKRNSGRDRFKTNLREKFLGAKRP